MMFFLVRPSGANISEISMGYAGRNLGLLVTLHRAKNIRFPVFFEYNHHTAS